MVLYTMMPEFLLFPETEQDKYKTVTVHDVPMLVQQQETAYEIVRLLSTNPQDYLNFHPGDKIII